VQGPRDYIRRVFPFRSQLQDLIRVLTAVEGAMLKVKHIAMAYQKIAAKYDWSGQVVHNYKLVFSGKLP